MADVVSHDPAIRVDRGATEDGATTLPAPAPKGMDQIHNGRGDEATAGTATGGSDGDRLREIDIVEWPLVPFLHADLELQIWERSEQRRYAVGARRPMIPHECWDEIVQRAQMVGLRETARALGVSHETVRRIVKGGQVAEGK